MLCTEGMYCTELYTVSGIQVKKLKTSRGSSKTLARSRTLKQRLLQDGSDTG